MRTRASERDATKWLDVLAAYITLLSIVYYTTTIALLHFLRTDLNPCYRYLSEYARGPYGVLMTSTFFVLSAGSLGLLVGLCRSVTSRLRFAAGLVSWLMWACTVFLAGIYTSDSNWFSPRSARNDRIYQCDLCPCAFVFTSALGERMACGLESRNALVVDSSSFLLAS